MKTAGRCCFKVLLFSTLLIVFAIRTRDVDAAIYDFTNIVDTTMHGFTNMSPFVSVNDSGTIAFEAERPGDGSGVYTIAADGTLSTIAKTSGTFFSSFSFRNPITNDGRVMFKAAYSVSGSDLLISDGTTTTTLLDDATDYFDSGMANRAGTTVAYRLIDNGVDQGVYTQSADGGPVTAVNVVNTSSSSSRVGVPAINNNGEIAFGGYVTENAAYQLVSGTAGSLTVRADIRPGSHGAVGMNDNSDLLYYGRLLGDDNFSIYLLQNGQPVQLIATSDNVDFGGLEGTPDINNNGFFVFQGGLPDGRYGMFTGGDPVNDAVLIAGDELFGSIVTSLQFYGGGLNENDQIAFYYALADGRSGYAIATQTVPEPSSCFLLLIVGCGVVWGAYRRRVTVAQAGI